MLFIGRVEDLDTVSRSVVCRDAACYALISACENRACSAAILHD